MRVAHALVGLLLLGSACIGADNEPSLAETASIEKVADVLGCKDRTEIDLLEAPIRGSAATRGLACEVGEAKAHVFERTQNRGGTLERLDDLLGIGEPRFPECRPMWVLTSDAWFVLSDVEDVLTTLQGEVDGDTQAIAPAAPPVSYSGPGC